MFLLPSSVADFMQIYSQVQLNMLEIPGVVWFRVVTSVVGVLFPPFGSV